MKLKSLKLENFRQHEDSFIEFTDGITIINGTNGAGKSTILEAITWSIYGTDAARGNKDTIKFNKAKARAKVRVELIFYLDDEVFRIERFLDKAELYLGDNQAPIVTTQQEVTKYLTDKLGMTKDEFFNTYFTGQKELNFLGNQKPLERRKFISKVLNYEKIREIQEQIRTDKNSINYEITGLKQGIADLDSLKEEKKIARAELEEINNNLVAKQKEFNKCTDEIAKIEPEWEKIKEIKEKFDKNTREIEFLTEKSAFMEKNIVSLKEKFENLEEKSKILAEISKFETEYKETDFKIKELEKLQEKEALRQTYLSKIEGLDKEIKEKTLQQEEVIKSGKEKRLIVDKIPFIKEEISDLIEKIKEIETKITACKKENEVLISQKQKEVEKTQKQLSLIKNKGEEGICPTCERTLKGEFEKVTGNFKDQIKTLEKEIQILKTEYEKLNVNSAELTEFKKKKEQKEKEYAELMNFQGQYEEEKRRFLIIKNEIETKTLEKIKIKEELVKIPEGFDNKTLNNLREKILPLRNNYEQILTLNAELADFDKIKNELQDSIGVKQEIETKKKQADKELKEFNYSEDSFLKIEKAFQLTKESFYNLKNELGKIEEQEINKKDKLEWIKKQEDSNKEKLNYIKEKQGRLDLLIELERFYGQFWEKLNNQARPEISELASKFLVDLTDGRYSELELNEKYEICLHDDGEIKPVISGGEEDLVNLCVRLAISQIIAQRSGKTLSLLILDEIFGSLDENRRNNVVNLLRNLINNFEQVILITHIEDIKNEIDNIITIEYNTEKGSSKIIRN
ncbi:MAG: AAA family ATPase [bacterium]